MTFPTIPQMEDRQDRATWNYEAVTFLGRAVRFVTSFIVVLFAISLLIRAAAPFYF